MLGRNHAVSSAAAWAASAPFLPLAGIDPISDPLLYASSIVLAGGAGVVPDLDHPDARPSSAFGIVSRLVSRLTAKAAGGHRKLTHSLPFAGGLGLATWGMVSLPFGNWAAGILVWGMVVFSLSLLGPSLGFRPPPLLVMIAGAALGWAVAAIDIPLTHSVRAALPFVLGMGCVFHTLGDWLTRGGVPLLYPFTKKRWAAGLFRTGSGAETGVGLVCAAGLFVAATYHMGLWEIVAGWAESGGSGEWLSERLSLWGKRIGDGVRASLGSLGGT